MFSSFSVLHAAVVAILLAASLAGGVQAKPRDPVRVAVGEATSQQVMARVAGEALERAGFKVEYVASTDADAVEQVATGAAYVHPALVAANARPALSQALEAQRIVSLGGLADNARDGAVLKIVWSGMRTKSPDAQKMLKTMIFPADELARMAQRVDEGQPLEQVVADWMGANTRVWRRWKSASTNWMKP